MEADDARRLAQFLSSHSDSTVRELACSFIAHNQFQDLLFELLHDQSTTVQKSAAYKSRVLSPERRFADRLWQLLMNPATQGYFATESLESYLIHTDDPAVNAHLQKLALEDERPDVKTAALLALQERGARIEIESVKQLLLEPPFNNWGVHRFLLEACAELRIPVEIKHLLSVDDLWLQMALAEYAGGLGR